MDTTLLNPTDENTLNNPNPTDPMEIVDTSHQIVQQVNQTVDATKAASGSSNPRQNSYVQMPLDTYVSMVIQAQVDRKGFLMNQHT